MSITLRFRWVCHGPGDCEGCAALNGQVRELDEWTVFPGFHPNCDCTLEPVYELINDGYKVPIISVQFIYPIWHVGPRVQQLYQYRRNSAPSGLITALNAEIVSNIKALNPRAFPPAADPVVAPPNVKPPVYAIGFFRFKE